MVLYSLHLWFIATAEEWIEIFNQNNFEVDLSQWQIADTSGKTTTYTFPKGTKIPSQGYLVFGRPTTKIVFNNNKDGLKLLQPNGKIIDSVSFEKAPESQSYNRGDKWFWSDNLSPGSQNIISNSINEENEDIEENEEELSKNEIATVSEPFKNLKFFPFLIALIIAIFSAIIVLALKRKAKL